MNFRELLTTNRWWGKFLGAIFGYLAGGPAGAIFGIFVGNVFDKGLAVHFSNPHLLYHAEKRRLVQKIFFEATFSVMGHIAKADGVVTERELKMAKTLMSEMRLSSEQKTQAKKLFNEGKLPSFNLLSLLTQLQNACRDNRELLKLFVDIQYRASMVDGLTAKKIKALDVIFTHFGFAPLHQQNRFYADFGHNASAHEAEAEERSYSSSQNQQYRSSNSTLDQAYALLEVKPTDTKQDIKRAYRKLMSLNHPDKLIAQGLPQEMIKIANAKTQKTLKAYELISSSKGW